VIYCEREKREGKSSDYSVSVTLVEILVILATFFLDSFDSVDKIVMDSRCQLRVESKVYTLNLN